MKRMTMFGLFPDVSSVRLKAGFRLAATAPALAYLRKSRRLVGLKGKGEFWLVTEGTGIMRFNEARFNGDNTSNRCLSRKL